MTGAFWKLQPARDSLRLTCRRVDERHPMLAAAVIGAGEGGLNCGWMTYMAPS
ncbi:hypothetical protein RchiOBHm_Chr2g0112231 [Rosa chinensis]|uniref:Uncharacterized protein n=1 Tax=Rosa chinensis TaxID=74649 RepID=A0A2P6RQ52_ROSCH|nr:hypothetical protein RchiOBHm_Chr2g0112231 [Rosa chinensis]